MRQIAHENDKAREMRTRENYRMVRKGKAAHLLGNLGAEIYDAEPRVKKMKPPEV